MKKSCLTRELANVFPSWSRTRQDEQSVGYQILNTLALPMERMEKALLRQRSNHYIATANTNEIDIVYEVVLPTEFEFDSTNIDPAGPTYQTPTVSGLIDEEWVDVTIASDNDIESFWYDCIPTRVTLDDTVSGYDHNLIDQASETFPVSGDWDHHLLGGTIWVEATSGIQYLQFANGKLLRAQLIIHGYTRKGTYETETLVFPWDMRVPSQKEWKSIEKIELTNFEDGVNIVVKSGNFNMDDYLSWWNLRYSDNRNKIDEFWGLGVVEGITTLDLVEYISDEWQQLVLGMTDKQVRESWELLDDSMDSVDPVDIALQPFQDRAWMVTTSGMLYCYSLDESMVENIHLIKDKTQGSNIQIDMEYKHVVLGEYIEFIPWHARPLKEIRKHRLWYQTPAGTKYGLLNGSPVAFTSDFWVKGEEKISRTVENLIRVQAAERGEYLFVFEAEYTDGEQHIDKVICSVNYKQPLASFDLSSLITDDILGIDFDIDQKLWVRTVDKYYKIGLHADMMLVDYENKRLYFKEDYSSVEVLTNG